MDRHLLSYLNRVFFQDIWNAIRAERRINMPIKRHNDRFITGCLQLTHDNINLPPGQFNVYILPHFVDTRNLFPEVETWVRSDTLLSKKDILWHIYYVSGIVLPKSHVYFYVPRHRDKIIVAISRLSILKTSTDYQEADLLYMTFYQNVNRHTHMAFHGDILEKDRKLAIQKELRRVYHDYQAVSPDGTDLWINGRRQPLSKLDDCRHNDIVEIISDPDVIGCVTIHPQQDRTKYFSHRDKIFKDIVHIPKQINPDNNLITHTTCTLYVEDRETGEGRYLHRTDPLSVTQLTHNDLSVSSSVVSALKQSMGAQSIAIHVQVRTHEHTKGLKPNRSFLHYLYDEPDHAILGHLHGTKSPSLPFWHAAVLETSAYVRMMFDIPSAQDHDMAAFYQDAIGYINLAKELCAHKTSHRNTKTVTITKPYFLKNSVVRPNVFKNGRQVPDKFVNYTNTITSVHIKLNVIYVGPSDEITVYLYRDNERDLYAFTPTADNPTLTLTRQSKHDHFYLYEKRPLETSQSGRNATSDYTYIRVFPEDRPGTFQVTTTSQEVQITWASSQYDIPFIVIPTTYTQYNRIDINPYLMERDPLIIPLSLQQQNDVSLPLTDEYEIDVSLNGYTLIPGLDYTRSPLRDQEGIVLTELMIASADKLNSVEDTNVLDIQTRPTTNIHTQQGFIYGKSAFIDPDDHLPIWVDGLSCAVIDNKTYMDGQRQKTTLSFDRHDDVTTGHPYSIHIAVPQEDMRICWSDTDFREDINRWDEVATYLNKSGARVRSETASNEPLIIEKPHKLYSPYLMAIIKDVLDGTLILRDDPNNATFLDQFMDHTYLRDRDPIYQMPEAYKDARFVDVHASYEDLFFVDESIYPMIDRLLTILLQDTRLLEKE